ncbi:MAG TPA: hypothetical protein DD670_19200 [Planctomycetaceae bacterium]|nr:hypothetical protein [Planctomycetaceae bacterium]
MENPVKQSVHGGKTPRHRRFILGILLLVLIVALLSCWYFGSPQYLGIVDPAQDTQEIRRIETQLRDGVLPEPPMWTLIHMASEEEKTKALEAFCSEKPKDEPSSWDLADAVRKAGGLAKYRQRIAGLLKSRDATVRGFAAVWLADLGDKAHAKDILALLESDDLPDDDEFNRSWDRGQAAFALGILGASEHSETLAKFLTHDDKYLRSGAAAGLARLGAKDYEREIAALLRDNDREVILAAIWALARLDAKQYRDEIAELAKSPDTDTAEAVAAALATLKDDSAQE